VPQAASTIPNSQPYDVCFFRAHGNASDCRLSPDPKPKNREERPQRSQEFGFGTSGVRPILTVQRKQNQTAFNCFYVTYLSFMVPNADENKNQTGSFVFSLISGCFYETELQFGFFRENREQIFDQ
jgi:hypothetical protein